MTGQKKEGRGGAREGAGAPKKHPLLKRERAYILLPVWLLDRLKDLDLSKSKEIEKSLCQVHGWQPPTEGELEEYTDAIETAEDDE